MESKHCVQSSRYTACERDGGFRSATEILTKTITMSIVVSSQPTVRIYMHARSHCCGDSKGEESFPYIRGVARFKWKYSDSKLDFNEIIFATRSCDLVGLAVRIRKVTMSLNWVGRKLTLKVGAMPRGTICTKFQLTVLTPASFDLIPICSNHSMCSTFWTFFKATFNLNIYCTKK